MYMSMTQTILPITCEILFQYKVNNNGMASIVSNQDQPNPVL